MYALKKKKKRRFKIYVERINLRFMSSGKVEKIAVNALDNLVKIYIHRNLAHAPRNPI